MKRTGSGGIRFFLGGTDSPCAASVGLALEEAGARRMAGCASGEMADHEEAVMVADLAVLCLGADWHMRDLEVLGRRNAAPDRPVVVVDCGEDPGVVPLARQAIPGCIAASVRDFEWVSRVIETVGAGDAMAPLVADGDALDEPDGFIEQPGGRSGSGDTLPWRLAGRELLVEFLRRFASASSAEFEKLGAWLLGEVGAFLGVDSAGFAFRRGERGGEFVRGEWTSDAREGSRRSSVLFSSVLEGAVRPSPSLPVAAHDRPDDGARGLARVRGARSVLAVALRSSGSQVGYFVVDSRECHRDWTVAEFEFIGRLGEVLASVADRLNAVEVREEMTARLAQARRMEAIGHLSGGLAHDFNNVLQPILGFGELLAERLEPGDPILEDLAEIRRSAERAAFLTRQMLTFSRKQVISLRPEPVHPLIDSVCTQLREAAGQADRLFVDLGADSPLAMLDASQFKQLLTNLVSNAREAMPRGGTVTVRTRRASIDEVLRRLPHDMQTEAGRFFCLEVTDEGPGISPDMRDKVFEPFFSTKGKEGAGLGLSVAYGIAEQHGGWITVDTAPVRGAVVRVFLPVAAETATPESETPELAGRTETTHRHARSDRAPRILVVEDEPAVLRFLVTALKQGGYEVIAAANFREGLDAFERNRRSIDMIFSDAVLPDGNGVELIDRLLAEDPSIKALLSSGYTDKERLLDVAQRREITFLQKPYSLPVLFSTVRKVLEREECAVLG